MASAAHHLPLPFPITAALVFGVGNRTDVWTIYGGELAKEIPLTQGYVTIVDDEDYEWLSQWKWQVGKGYAQRGLVRERGKQTTQKMHRLIMGVDGGDPEVFVDHINGDPLDNRRSNLRLCNRVQNWSNSHTPIRNATGFRGVIRRPRGRFSAQCKNVHLGDFATAQEAAKAYDKAAYERYGEFARLNFPNTEGISA